MKSKTVVVQPLNHAHRPSTQHRSRRQPILAARPYSFTLTEFHQLLAAAGNDEVANELRQIATIIFCTGIRKNELRDLAWTDVDLDKRTMCVGTKGFKQRTVPFGHNVLEVFADRAKSNTGQKFVVGNSPAATLRRIAQRLHTLPSTTDGRKFTLHTLRHSFAIQWLSAGGGIVEPMAVMGFSSLRPVFTFYSLNHIPTSAALNQSQLGDETAN